MKDVNDIAVEMMKSLTTNKYNQEQIERKPEHAEKMAKKAYIFADALVAEKNLRDNLEVCPRCDGEAVEGECPYCGKKEGE